MTTMTPALDQALSGATPTIFGAIEIVLPHHTLRLLTGAGVLAFGGKVFAGEDTTYGVLYSVEDLTDGAGDEAPALTLTLLPKSNAAAADLAGPDMQGSTVSIWLGAVDPASGQVIGDPLLVFLGALDVPTLRTGQAGRLLDFDITSAFEDFFFNDEGARLSDTFHQYVWPGERGLAYVTGVDEQVYWGSDAPSGVRR